METFSLGTNPPISAPFRGFSANNPDLLDPGVFAQADNAVWDSGILRTRPGLRAQLTTPLGQIGAGIAFQAGLYDAITHALTDGNAYALLVAGADATAGIYRWQEDNAAATLVSGGVVFNRDKVQFAIYGDFIFISGAVNGNLYRYRFQNADTFLFESAVGLVKPTYGLTSALTNQTGAIITVAATWQVDTQTVAMAFPDSDFSSGSVTTAWTVLGGVIDLHTNVDPANPSENYCRMDEIASSIILTNFLALDPKVNSYYTGASRYATHILVDFDIKCDRSIESLIVFCIGYDAGGTQIASVSEQFTAATPGVGSAGPITHISHVYTLPVMDDTTITKVKIMVNAGPLNTAGPNGPYFSNMIVDAATPQTVFRPDGDKLRVYVTGATSARYGLYTTSGPLSFLPVGQERFGYQLSSSTDFSAISQIAIPYVESVTFPDFSPRLGLRTGTAAAPVYTDPLERFTDIDGSMYLVADLSVLSTGARTGINYLELLFDSDVSLPGGDFTGNVYFSLGNMVQAGRLTADANYSYRVREYDTDGSGVIVSPATDRTGAILATRAKAQGQVTFSAGPPTNTALPNRPPLGAGTHNASIEVWRDGGTFEDGLDRLVARFVSGADISFTTNGGLWAWTEATMSAPAFFTDNTPDILLIGAPTLEDHDATPTSTSSLATFAGRLVASIGAVLHLSQSVTGRATGLYWTNVYDSEAPNAESQGQVISVSGEGGFAGGDVVAMIVHLSRLAILMPHAPFFLIGTRPPFELRHQQTDTYYGGVSHRSVFVSGGELVYLSADGLRVYNGVNTDLISRDIEQLLNPYGLLNGPALNVAAYKSAFVSAQASRVYLSAPLPGGSAIAVLYVYDRRVGVWTKWLTGNLSGCLRFADADKVYFTGANGQIYRLGPEWGDTATRLGGATGVTLTLTSRNFMNRGQSIKAQRFTANVECADATPSYVFTATADENSTAKRWTYPIAPGTGRKRLPLKRTRPGEKVSPNVHGSRIALGLTVTTVNPVTLHSWELVASIGVP